jgi:hypothetical protein
MIVVMVLRERFVRSSHHSRAGNGCAEQFSAVHGSSWCLAAIQSLFAPPLRTSYARRRVCVKSQRRSGNKYPQLAARIVCKTRPKLAQLKTGVGFMAKATTVQDGERWYAFQFTAGGPPAAFGKAEDFR